MSRRHYNFIFLNFFAHEMTQLDSLIPFVDFVDQPLEGKTEYIALASISTQGEN
jgi:hypothetical protein